ncbi:MAG: hypothetical protein RLY43_48 [Bacteroidota bacterium]|jgi:hypothetical protein
MYLNEEILKIRKAMGLHESFENDSDKIFVYHVARDSKNDDEGYKKIFKFGFESFFLAKGAGQMYGRGIYTTTDLESSINNAHKGSYGKVILKCEVPSMNGFLIWDHNIAKKVYGEKWRMEDQLNLLLPSEIIQEMKTKQYSDGTLYGYLCKSNREYTSESALAFYQSSSHFNGKQPYNFVEGFAFRGRNDGNVGVIKDVKNIIPLEYSLDFGKTWVKGYTDQTIKYTKDDFDVDYKFGSKYRKTEPPSNGYAKVWNNEGKINYISKEGNEISKVWFDSGDKFDEHGPDFYLASVDYNGHLLFLATDGQIFESPEDDFPMCDSSELPTIFK